jgi:hypothetical protein
VALLRKVVELRQAIEQIVEEQQVLVELLNLEVLPSLVEQQQLEVMQILVRHHLQ